MAEIAAVQATVGNFSASKKASWVGMASGDTGSPVDMHDSCNKTVQVTGNFGVGGTVAVQASLDNGVTWSRVRDSANNPIEFTSAAVRDFVTTAPLIRPAVTAGSTVSVNVHMFALKRG